MSDDKAAVSRLLGLGPADVFAQLTSDLDGIASASAGGMSDSTADEKPAGAPSVRVVGAAGPEIMATGAAPSPDVLLQIIAELRAIRSMLNRWDGGGTPPPSAV